LLKLDARVPHVSLKPMADRFNLQFLHWFTHVPNLLLLALVVLGVWALVAFVRVVVWLAHTPSPHVVHAAGGKTERRVVNPWRQ